MLTWLGILLCLFHAALFSGLTLGLFGLSLLRLEVMAATRHSGAAKILRLRQDASLLLATLLWGNVSANVLLTLLTDSILTGVGAFIFSTVSIMFIAELAPQAYFSRSALRAGAMMVPLVRFYQFVLYPVAKPTAWLVDLWLGKEGIQFFREDELKTMLRLQGTSAATDVGQLEGLGAANFLALDDVLVEDEGEVLDPLSIIVADGEGSPPTLPVFMVDPSDSFLMKVRASGKKWVVFVDRSGMPQWVLNADKFLRALWFKDRSFRPADYYHRPIVITTPGTNLEQAISKFRVQPEHVNDDVIDQDLILYWGPVKRIITGADILGRLLRGIVPADR